MTLLASAVDSVAYTYVHFWGKAYQKLYARQFRRFLSYSRRKIDLDSPEEHKMALAALKQALGQIEKQFGKSEVRWGEVNVAVRGGRGPVWSRTHFFLGITCARLRACDYLPRRLHAVSILRRMPQAVRLQVHASASTLS